MTMEHQDVAMLKPLNRILAAIRDHEGPEAATPERAEEILEMLLDEKADAEFHRQRRHCPVVDKIDMVALRAAPHPTTCGGP
jgi:hypothetical protein